MTLSSNINDAFAAIGADIKTLFNWSSRKFNTVADMVAATDLSVGDFCRTRGYYAARDGGGNLYEIVAAATGTADGGSFIDITGSTVQAKAVWDSNTFLLEQFGAVGDAHADNGTPTDDTAAINAAIEWSSTLNKEVPWSQDDRTGDTGEFGPGNVISGLPGRVYGISDTLQVDSGNRNDVLANVALRAIGTWTSVTTPMIAPEGVNGTYFHMRNVQLNCERKCSGILTQAFWDIDRPIIRYMASGGYGIKTQGVKTQISRPDIKEWTSLDSEFFNEANYGAIGVHINSDDNRILDGEIGWCEKLIRHESGVNTEIERTHLFNGMEDFADYNLDGTFVGGGTGTAVGRDDPIILEKDVGNDHTIRLWNVYLDNGRLDIYNDFGVSLDACHFNSNSNHSNANQTEWIRNYAYGSSVPNRMVVINPLVGVRSLEKKLISWLAYSTNTWSADTTAFEASSQNNLNSSAIIKSISQGFQFYAGTDNVMWLFGQATKAFIRMRDKDSTGYSGFGVDTDQVVIETPNGSMRVEDDAANVNFKVDADGVILPDLASAPASPVAGQMYFDTTDGNHKVRADGRWKKTPEIEVGTYVPEMGDDALNTVSLSPKTIPYVRIDDEVTVYFNFITNIDPTGLTLTDDFRVSLPYPVENHSFMPVGFQSLDVASSLSDSLFWYAAAGGGAWAKVRDMAAANTLMTYNDLDTSGNTSDLIGGTLTYRAEPR